MIISTTTLKGGGGKTTIAVNLSVYFAAQGKSVLLIDCDENQNSIKWASLRDVSRANVTVVSLTSSEVLRNSVHSLAERYDVTVMDGVPAVSNIAITIMLLSDVCIFPVIASPFDIWAFNDTFLPKFEEVQTLKEDIIGKVVINNYEPNTKISKDVIEAIEDAGIKPLGTKLHSRTVYKGSIAYGIGAMEMNDKKAITEITELGKEIQALLN